MPSTNLQFGNPRQSSVAVRGPGNNPANDVLEGSVGVYLDNVYLGRPVRRRQHRSVEEKIKIAQRAESSVARSPKWHAVTV